MLMLQLLVACFFLEGGGGEQGTRTLSSKWHKAPHFKMHSNFNKVTYALQSIAKQNKF